MGVDGGGEGTRIDSKSRLVKKHSRGVSPKRKPMLGGKREAGLGEGAIEPSEEELLQRLRLLQAKRKFLRSKLA
eukprot:jgi/Bigna1/62857/fgenesh1_kg.43_\